MNPKTFWQRTERSGNDGCLLWTGTKNSYGYGRFTVGGKRHMAHRYAFELEFGLIPKGMQIDHLCRIPACVNPQHLEAVTNQQNSLRGVGPTAINARKTHCINRHPYDLLNTYIRPDGARRCMECARMFNKKYYWRDKARNTPFMEGQ